MPGDAEITWHSSVFLHHISGKVIALSVNGEKHEAVRYPLQALPDDLLQRLQEHFTVHQVQTSAHKPSNKMQQFLPKLKVTGFKREC